MDKKISMALILTLSIAAITACQPIFPTVTPTPSPMPTSTAPVPTSDTVKIVDPAKDPFNNSGETISGEPYMDILGAEVSLTKGYYVARIKVNGPMPLVIEAPTFVEWDIMVDSDSDAGTGWDTPLLFGNIGADYRIFLGLQSSGYGAYIHDIKANTYDKIEYKIESDTIELRVPQSPKQPASFNFTVASRKYAKADDPGTLIVADRAPNQGYCNFPGGLKGARSGLPTLSFQLPDATVFYNSDNEDRAKWFADAFEFAYQTVGKELGVYPQKKSILYVYNTQDDLVQGLQEFSGFSADDAAFFKEKSQAPRPINYVMHISPSFRWDDVVHEYTHTIIEEISGNAYKSIKWLDEGLATYFQYETLLQTKYKETEPIMRQRMISVCKQALDRGNLPGLSSMSTENQWMARGGSPEWDLQYMVSGGVIYYLSQKYSVSKCLEVFKQINKGDSQEIAVKNAIGISVDQLESNFKVWVGQQN